MRDEQQRQVPETVFVKHNFYELSLQQREDAAVRLMADLGHPFAADYHRFRAFYDALPYCSDANFRFYACVDERNFVEYGAPTLNLGGGERRNEATVRASAAAGWPGPLQRDCGSFFVTVAQPELKRALATALNMATPRKTMVQGVRCQTPERFCAVKAIIDRLFAGYLLVPVEWQRFDGCTLDPQMQPLLAAIDLLATAKDAWI